MDTAWLKTRCTPLTGEEVCVNTPELVQTSQIATIPEMIQSTASAIRLEFEQSSDRRVVPALLALTSHRKLWFWGLWCGMSCGPHTSGPTPETGVHRLLPTRSSRRLFIVPQVPLFLPSKLRNSVELSAHTHTNTLLRTLQTGDNDSNTGCAVTTPASTRCLRWFAPTHRLCSLSTPFIHNRAEVNYRCTLFSTLHL